MGVAFKQQIKVAGGLTREGTPSTTADLWTDGELQQSLCRDTALENRHSRDVVAAAPGFL